MQFIKKRLRQGFTMVELLIAIAIVAVLAAIAVPSYYNYIKKADFSQVVMYADAYRNYVAECISRVNSAEGCSNGAYNIPVAIQGVTDGPINSVVVSKGVITVTPNRLAGMEQGKDYSYVLTPTLNNATQVITWKVSGGACDNKFVECNVDVASGNNNGNTTPAANVGGSN